MPKSFFTWLVWAAVLLATTAIGARAGVPDARRSLSFQVLWAGAPEVLWHPQGVDVARTPEELAALIRQISPRAPVPDVDFQTSMVIGYFAGSRGSSGHWLEIDRVVHYTGECIVEVTERVPGGGCFVLPEGTYPYILVLTHKWPGPVRVESRTRRQDCH